MKIHGKTYPVSMLKMYLDDKIWGMLDQLTKNYHQGNNREMVAALIQMAYSNMLDNKKVCSSEAVERKTEDHSKE